MFGSFFQYLSFLGYFVVLLGILEIFVWAVAMIDLCVRDSVAKLEKGLRYTGTSALMVMISAILVFLDWANNHPYVNQDGSLALDIPQASLDIWFWVIVSLSAIWLSFLGVSKLMKWRRERRAIKRYTELYAVFREEHGSEEAGRMMIRAGHRQELQDTLDGKA